jgi:hypothetical protein
MTRIETGEVLDLLNDIKADLDMAFDTDLQLLAFVNARRSAAGFEPHFDLPGYMTPGDAAQAVAKIIASNLNSADPDNLDFAMQEMMTDRGLRYENFNATLWVESTDVNDTIVVWLGNLVDYDMTDLGRAEVNAD